VLEIVATLLEYIYICYDFQTIHPLRRGTTLDIEAMIV